MTPRAFSKLTMDSSYTEGKIGVRKASLCAPSQRAKACQFAFLDAECRKAFTQVGFEQWIWKILKRKARLPIE